MATRRSSTSLVLARTIFAAIRKGISSRRSAVKTDRASKPTSGTACIIDTSSQMAGGGVWEALVEDGIRLADYTARSARIAHRAHG